MCAATRRRSRGGAGGPGGAGREHGGEPIAIVWGPRDDTLDVSPAGPTRAGDGTIACAFHRVTVGASGGRASMRRNTQVIDG